MKVLNLRENKKIEDWSIVGIWNEELEQNRKEVKERDYISASDIGKPYLDRYLKMNGVPETNPFEPRVLRVLAAGDEFHAILRRFFRRLGLLIDYEKRVEIPATEKTLKVLGYYDLMVGGKVNVEEGNKAIEEEDFTPFLKEKAKRILNYFAEKYPDGIKPIICEVKSVHSASFWRFQNEQKSGYLTEIYPHYELQLYTYLKATGLNEGRILLISKDDLTIAEFVVMYPNKRLEEKWREDVEKMSYYYLTKTMPPKEPDIVYDEKVKKWKINWRVERSPYLSYITKLSKDEWLKKVKKELALKNKELKKVVNKIKN